MPTALTQATYTISDAVIERMILDSAELPGGLAGFQLARSGYLDNHTMAEQGFPGNSAEGFARIGRITGFLAEYANPAAGSAAGPGVDVAAGAVVHLFDREDSVKVWMHDIFLRQFQENVGESSRDGSELVSVEKLDARGFADEAVSLRATHRGTVGLVSSTVIDFRVGRLLGVAFVVSTGDLERLDVTTDLALALERRMVSVTLGG